MAPSTSTSTSISPYTTTDTPLRRILTSKPIASTTQTSITSHHDDDSEHNPISISTSDDTSSITHSLLPHSDSTANIAWNPTSVLQIQSQGKGWFSFPIFASEAEIPILSETSEKKYVCEKSDKRSGTCYLVAVGAENKKQVARTKYTWSPFRKAVVWIAGEVRGRNESGVTERGDGSEEEDQSAEGASQEGEGGESFEVVKKAIWSYTFCFESAKRRGKFEWRYAGHAERKGFGKDINNLLVLEKIIPATKEGGKPGRIRIAQLVRGPETRTPGTKASDAGNGGRLEMSLQKNEGEMVIDEVTVVLTCLVMLKKEIDRARARQIAMMSSPGVRLVLLTRVIVRNLSSRV